jgi:hypothetical protein
MSNLHNLWKSGVIMSILDNLDSFNEREHGYVFNTRELNQLITEIRNKTIDECADVCNNLAELTKPCPTGEEFKHCYIFAMDRILNLKVIDK